MIGTRALRIVTLLSLVLLAGCKTVRPWERGALAHPSMTADSPQGPAEEHMRSVHEGATGGQWRRGRWRVRLQLGRARLAAVATVLFVAAPDVRADDEPAETEAAPVEAVPVAPAGKVPSPYVVQASSEIAGYQDSFATTVLTPSIGGRIENTDVGWSAQGRYLVDMVSAASPDVVTTASRRWTETRQAGNASVGYKPGPLGGLLSGSVSYTPDYLSRGIAGTAILDVDEKRSTFSLSFGYARDTIRTHRYAVLVFSRTLDTFSGALVATRVLGPATLGVAVADVIIEDGDSSKPYRYVPLFAPADVDRVGRGASVDEVARLRTQVRPLEQLPLTRDRFALTLRVIHRFHGATLRVEERFYGDSWGIASSSTDARASFDLGTRVVLGPTARLHAQTAAGFYRRAYASNGAGDVPVLRTGDRELGALVGISAGAAGRVGIGRDADPMALAIGFYTDGTLTELADALYVERRYSILTAVTVDAKF